MCAGAEAAMAEAAMLDEDVERALDAFVQSGRYASRSEAIRDAVRLLEEQERELADLDAALDDIAAGRVKPATEVFDRLEAKYKAMIEER
jgi:antitoxin ParD1/3/4